MRILILLLAAISAQATVTTYRVRTTGGDYAMTPSGFRSAYAACFSLNDPGGICIVDVEAYSVANTCLTDTVPYIFPAQTNGNKLVILRTSRLSDLPANTRVGRAEGQAGTGKLACAIVNGATTTDAVFQFPAGVSNQGGSNCQTYSTPVSHVLIQGWELQASGNAKHLSVIAIGMTDAACVARQAAQAPSDIDVDRVWMHGVDTLTWLTTTTSHDLIDGIRLYGDKVTVRNSTCEELNTRNGDTPESHCITADNAPNDSFVFNNAFDASIGSIWGGGYPQRRGLNPVRVRTYGNLYYRTGLAVNLSDWDTSARLDTGSACTPGMMWVEQVSPSSKWKCDSNGTWQASSEVRNKNLWVKNGWEIKSASDVEAEGNVVRQIFPTGDGNQSGPAFLINNVDPSASANAYWARPYKIRLRFNRSERTGAGLQTSWAGPLYQPIMRKQMERITFEHNLLEGINHISIHPTQGSGTLFGVPFGGVGVGLYSSGISKWYTATRNTVLYSQSFGGTGMVIEDDGVPNIVYNVNIRDNILFWGSVGQRPSIGNEACTAFNAAMAGTRYWNNFALVDSTARGSTAFNTVYNGTGCPSTKARLALGSEGFVDYNDGYDGDYRVCLGDGNPVGCSSASGAATLASDGGPAGADAAQVAYAVSGVEAGVADLEFFRFQIRRADKDEIRYTSYDGQACTGTIKNLAGSTVDSWTDSGGDRDRTHTPTSLSPGEHTARVTCASRWKEETFVSY